MSLVTSSYSANVVFRILKESIVDAQITGDIYLGTRPDNSNLEDIVINTLPITFGSTQLQYLNVNLFVADIARSTNHYQPDTLRIQVLCDMILNALNYISTQKYTITIESNDDDNALPEQRQHWANFRLLIQIHEPIN